mmetsp:Transcript_20812/g.57834  ORF Transcript_20812/g.57834 Transcript_20812/m.57834 type:complete len:83 (-) Transcript_20812:1273-1521(-)
MDAKKERCEEGYPRVVDDTEVRNGDRPIDEASKLRDCLRGPKTWRLPRWFPPILDDDSRGKTRGPSWAVADCCPRGGMASFS